MLLTVQVPVFIHKFSLFLAFSCSNANSVFLTPGNFDEINDEDGDTRRSRRLCSGDEIGELCWLSWSLATAVIAAFLRLRSFACGVCVNMTK